MTAVEQHSSNSIPVPVPVLIIGGFLGAGKTTLLNHILSENHGIRAAVLVNDFGAINIDAKLVVGVEGETINLANGCVCCSIRDDLVAACVELVQQSEPPELLIVETSGVSDPVQVANTFLMPELRSWLELSGIIAVVDVDQLPKLVDDSAALAWLQIKAADMVVLNKVDLVDSEKLAGVKEEVSQVSSGARMLEAIHGQVPLEFLLGIHHHAADVRPREAEPVGAAHADSADHSFATWHWTSDQPLSLPKLREVFECLPDTVYRAKGILYLEELPAYRLVLQMVGKRSSIRDTGQWEPECRRSEIVVIGTRDGIDEQVLQQTFDTCVGTGDATQSPILRLAREFGLNESTEDRSEKVAGASSPS